MASKSPRNEYLSKSQWCLISMWSCMLIFFFFLIPLSFLATRQSEASSAGFVRVSRSGKSCIPSWTSWHAIRPADLFQGQGVCGCCCTAGQYVFGRLWFFTVFAGQTHMSTDPVPCGVVMGHFLWPFLDVQTNSCKQMEQMIRPTASVSLPAAPAYSTGRSKPKWKEGII